MGGYIGEDYHKNMDDKFFIAWLSNRFIPTFSVKFPNKKCILILDNANYHHAKGEDYMSPSGTKKELIAKLKTLDVPSIKVERDGMRVEMDSSSWSHRKSNIAPSVKELGDALKVELAKHPERQRTEVKKLFDERGWQLIYTPPYTPQVQPIEKVWAYVKHHIASLFTPNRSETILLTHTILAFYGDLPHLHSGVTAELCQSLINYSNKWCNQFIHHHIKEDGDLSSLANWLNENPLEESVEDESEDEIEGAREEGENEVYCIFDFENSLNED
jgi:transposase